MVSAPRVLIVVENLSVPFDRRVWQESRALTDAGYEVHVVCPTGTKRDTEREVVLEGVHIHRYPLRPATGGPLGFVREYGLALFHSLRLSLRHGLKRRFDVVHVCNPPDLLFLVALPHKLRGAKVLFDHHDLVPELFRSRFEGGATALLKGTELAERITFAVSNGVISTNESYRRVALDRGKKAPEDVTVVRSAPDLARFEMAAPEPALKRGKRFLACYLGVMGPQDGIDYALRSLAHLKHDVGRTDLHTVFMGSGDAFDDMVALATELDLDDCVEFTGRVSDADVCRYLSTADVCLAPDPKNPLNDVSTMNKIMEYMAMERPLVSFDLIEAKVSAGDAALYATPNEVSEFGDLIAQLLDDPDRRAEMGAVGRKRVEGELSWDHSRRHLVNAYEHLLGAS
ncbi:MAG: glycosyltransferase family 4 protein [Actinomycetota bacterium]